MYFSNDQNGFGICSELKGLADIADPLSTVQFPGGHYAVLDLDAPTDQALRIVKYYDVFHGWTSSFPSSSPSFPFTTDTEETIISKLVELLMTAVRRRTMCDRQTSAGHPAIGAYLSGGFDSSAIASLLSRIYPGKLETFSIGFEGAPDLLNARKVAEYIGSKHHEVVVTEEDMLASLEEVTEQIESPDVTTNRASAFMMMLSRYIRAHSDVIVVFSGEGSDELFGSYLYFHNAPSSDAFHQETLRLLKDLRMFDLLRGDKASAVAGLEIRVPFLDIDFVEYAKTIPPEYKLRNGIEKYILRKALQDYLPSEICWRTKEAMSDGVSVMNRSWSTIIQEHLKARHASTTCLYGPDQRVNSITDPVQLERQWFRYVFTKYYPGADHTVPYAWLPKWCGDVQDCSARVLDIYRKKNEATNAEQ